MRAALVLCVVLCATGCPPDPSEPTRPDNAQVCAVDGDCAPDGGDACGAVLVCVDQRCEESPSLFVPCR